MRPQIRRKMADYKHRKNLSESMSTGDFIQTKRNVLKYNSNQNYLSWKEKLSIFLESTGFIIYSCILIVITLVIDDFKKLTTNVESDNIFDIINVVIIILCVLEIILYFIADESYACGLFFFIDIIGILSLVLDITTINNKKYVDMKSDKLKINSNLNLFLKLLKSIKIFRIIRIGKLVKMINRIFTQRKNPNKIVSENDISSRFVDFSTKKFLIFFVLLLLSVMLFIASNFYNTPFYDTEYGVSLFSSIQSKKINNNFLQKTFEAYITHFKVENKNILIFAKFGNFTYINQSYNVELRREEESVYFYDCVNEQNSEELNNNHSIEFEKYFNYDNLILYTEEGFYDGEFKERKIMNSLERLSRLGLIPSQKAMNGKCIAVYDSKYYNKKSCELNLIRTAFTLLVFIIGFLIFSIDINTLVLDPIENMTSKIENMSKNPISSLETLGGEVIKKPNEGCRCFQASKDGYEMLESQMLESKISKICSLLSLGFGEAGSTIISSVLQDGVNVDINPIIPGKKIMGIYGFCDIRNFTDTTEVLQEHVMVFVNQVAEIVHETVADYCGSANKNVGDAFLLVWKFAPKFIKDINKNGEHELKLKKTIQVSQFCDMALISFVKILMEIQKSYKLAVYRDHPGLNARMKNYRTKLGFGLHLGQSIEGAIGSMFKIDASYLSPNVNQANNLEEYTKTFEKELIMSGEFYDYLSNDSKKQLRLLDIYKTKNNTIQRIYSIDLDLLALPIEKPEDSMFRETDITKKMEKIKVKRSDAKILYDSIVLRHKYDVWNEFIDDEDFKIVREKYNEKFIENYNNGMEYFRSGNWKEAKRLLESAQDNLCDPEHPDPACIKHLNYMEKFNYIAPNNWKGYKEGEDEE